MRRGCQVRARYTADNLIRPWGASVVRLKRRSLRTRVGSTVLTASCVLSLGLLAGCGAGTAAAPTPTVALTTVPSTVPAPSPQRPALASPVASPSAVTSTATSPAPTPEVAGQTYEVQSGDTLATIAQQFYDDGTQWRRIYDANKDTIGADPDKLKIGMKLTIPPKQ